MKDYSPLDKPFVKDYSLKKDEALVFIGDIHGCLDELEILLFEICREFKQTKRYVLLGDLVDRGPKNIETIKYCSYFSEKPGNNILIGNHDKKLISYCLGKNVVITKDQEWFRSLSENDINMILYCYLASPSAMRFNIKKKRVYAAHAAIPDSIFINHRSNNPLLYNPIIDGKWQISKTQAAICYYGNTTGKKLESGYPERLHKPCLDPDGINIMGHMVHDINYCRKDNEPGTSLYLDHGGVFGSYLSAAVFTLNSDEPTIISIKTEAYKALGQEPNRI